MAIKHMIIPDTQCKPNADFQHLSFAGQYAVDKKPDVIVFIGDHWDMPSLSSYDVGKKSFEGRRYIDDIQAGQLAMATFLAPLELHNIRAREQKKKLYLPRLVFCLGNHEERINKAVESDRKLEGLISTDDLELDVFGFEVVPFLQPIVIDGVAYCLEENHEVLTKGLIYKPLKDLKIGDELIAFEENPTDSRTRKYCSSVVQKHETEEAELFEVLLSCGKSFKCTAEHLWLAKIGTKFDWVRTDKLTHRHKVVKGQNYFKPDLSHDAGYLAGVFDGEGWVSKPNCTQGGIQLGFAQRDNACLVRSLEILDRMGIKYKKYKHTEADNPVYNVRILGSSADKLEFLGRVRPERLISNFYPEMLGRLQKQDGDNEHYVINVAPCGKGRIVKMQTSSGTFIAEGFAHHNCHYFTSGILGRPVSSARAMLTKKHMSCVMGHVQDRAIDYQKRADGKNITGIFTGIFYPHKETYLTPQTDQSWAGVWMLHDVKDGEFDEMPVSLSYLRRRYGSL